MRVDVTSDESGSSCWIVYSAAPQEPLSACAGRGLNRKPSPARIPARTQNYQRPPAACFGARSSRDIVHVKPVPAGIGEEVQAASAADDLSLSRERFPVGEHDPVFPGSLGTSHTDRYRRTTPPPA